METCVEMKERLYKGNHHGGSLITSDAKQTCPVPGPPAGKMLSMLLIKLNLGCNGLFVRRLMASVLNATSYSDPRGNDLVSFIAT